MKLFELFQDFNDEPGNEEPRPHPRDIRDVYTPEYIASYIKENCSEYLSVTLQANKFLYRGVTTTSTPVFVGRPRDKRTPTGQSESQQAILDMLLKASGFKALRSNSISCISDENVSEAFGIPYLIFPVNGFDYTWSKWINDIGSSSALVRVLTRYRRKDQVDYEDVDAFLRDTGFRNNDLEGALFHDHEVSIAGKYIAVKAHHSIAEKVKAQLRKN